MKAPQTIGEAAIAVLQTANASKKAKGVIALYKAWGAGTLAHSFPLAPPDRPDRPEKPELRAPRDMPRRRRGGTEAARIAILHAVAHIELNAIDLALDIVARFGADMPRSFTTDWLSVAADEGRHFMLLSERLATMGKAYGDLPAHDGLWQAAMDTAHNLAARLAIVPMVLEARGLDVTPKMIGQFEGEGDVESATILKRILQEEVAHVAFGAKWFKHMADLAGEESDTMFKHLVAAHFKGSLKPPFNDALRQKAGMRPGMYKTTTA